jgi:hypothetical protein
MRYEEMGREGNNGGWLKEHITLPNVMLVAVLVFQIGGIVRDQRAQEERSGNLEVRVTRLENARSDERFRLDTVYMPRDLATGQYQEILRRLDAIDQRIAKGYR